MLLCSFRDYISYSSSSKVGVLEYVYYQRPQACLPEATNSVLDGCRFSVRHIQNFGDMPCCYWSAYMLSMVCLHVVTGLPTCCHWSVYMLSLVCLHVVTGLPTCCHWSAYMLSLVCLHVVTGLPTCCHWSAYMLSLVCLHILSSTSSVHHHSISQTVRKRPHPKAGVSDSYVAEVRP